MSYVVYGEIFCMRCDVVSRSLDNKHIDYEYKYFNELDIDEQSKLIEMANEINITSLPLIYNTETQKLVTYESLMGD